MAAAALPTTRVASLAAEFPLAQPQTQPQLTAAPPEMSDRAVQLAQAAAQVQLAFQVQHAPAPPGTGARGVLLAQAAAQANAWAAAMGGPVPPGVVHPEALLPPLDAAQGFLPSQERQLAANPELPRLPECLTWGLRTAAEVEAECAAHVAELEEAARRGEELLERQFQQQREELAAAAARMKNCVQGPCRETSSWQIEQFMHEQELLLKEKYAAALASFRESHRAKRERLEQKASQLASEYNTRKQQEDAMRDEYERQKARYDDLTRASPEAARQRLLMQTPRMHREVL